MKQNDIFVFKEENLPVNSLKTKNVLGKIYRINKSIEKKWSCEKCSLLGSLCPRFNNDSFICGDDPTHIYFTEITDLL